MTNATELRSGAQILCEALIREGVEVMFGIPGGAIMPFYHAMWEYRDRLRHVLCRHEQGAGHAAEEAPQLVPTAARPGTSGLEVLSAHPSRPQDRYVIMAQAKCNMAR